jgi:hypothetical protein
MQAIDPVSSPTTSSPQAQGGTKAPPRPRLAKGQAAPADAMTAVRRFFVGLPEENRPEMPAGTLPALLHGYRGAAVRGEYPVFLPPVDGAAEALPLSLTELLGRLLPEKGPLSDHQRRLERAVRSLLEDKGAAAEAASLVAAAGEAVRRELALPETDDANLASALDALVAAVPAGGRLLGWSDGAPLVLLRHAAAARLRPARAAFLDEVREVAAGLTAMLGGGAAKGSDASLGSLGSRFVDPSRLAGVASASRSSSRMDGARRQRLESARDALLRFIADGTTPALSLLAENGLAPAPAHLEGWTVEETDDPLAAAAERFDAVAGELAAVLRAVRLARLEASGDYLPERHGPALERLDWHAFSADEMALLPPLVVRVSAAHAAGDGLLALSRLLLSARPVQVMVEVEPAASPAGAAPLDGVRFELASLGLGHREAFVQQSGRARPVQMAAGFARALASGRAALHVVDTLPENATAAAATLDPFLVAGAALEGRAHPLFVYDPAAGEGWARRLDFSRNPSPAQDWSDGELVVSADGGERTLDLAFTFADYALLDASLADSFRPLPAGLEDDDLVPMADWLAFEPAEAAHRVPWIWAVDGSGNALRLAVGRRLARACRDRLAYWRTLQEMAGVRSEHAERAAAAARSEAEQAAGEEMERLRQAHAAEMEQVERRAAEEVVDRLTRGLLGLEPGTFVAPGAAVGVSLPPALGGNADEVTASLLAAVGTPTDEGASEAAPSPQVSELTDRLLSLLDPAELEV